MKILIQMGVPKHMTETIPDKRFRCLGECEYLSPQGCSGPVDDGDGSRVLYNSESALLVHYHITCTNDKRFVK